MELFDALIARLAPLLPGVITVITGGGVLKFIFWLVERHDGLVKEQRQTELTLAEQAKLWEMAFRNSDSWAKGFAMLILPSAIAFRSGKKELACEMLSLVCDEHLERDTGGKGWRMKPFPNFLDLARRDFDKIKGTSVVESEAKPKATKADE